MKNIAVICGGYSGESVVSLRSAEYVLENLNKDKYKAYKIIIDRGNWYYERNSEKYFIDKNDFSLNIGSGKIVFDGVYNIIHGDPGENGKLQAYFEMIQIPYSSCDSLISALTFNKAYCNSVVKDLGVNIASSVHFYKGAHIDYKKVLEVVGIPCFVKPNAGGSSIGMTKVMREEELPEAIERAF